MLERLCLLLLICVLFGRRLVGREAVKPTEPTPQIRRSVSKLKDDVRSGTSAAWAAFLICTEENYASVEDAVRDIFGPGHIPMPIFDAICDGYNTAETHTPLEEDHPVCKHS